jgi:hypothetical protein
MVKGEALTFIDCSCSFLMLATHTTAVFFHTGARDLGKFCSAGHKFSGTLFILILLQLLPGLFLEILFCLTLKLPPSTIFAMYKI